MVPEKMTLYQYEVCPFCNKVKAFLEYNNIVERQSTAPEQRRDHERGSNHLGSVLPRRLGLADKRHGNQNEQDRIQRIR